MEKINITRNKKIENLAKETSNKYIELFANSNKESEINISNIDDFIDEIKIEIIALKNEK